MMSHPFFDWHRQQLLEEADAERLAALVPRQPRAVNLHLRRRLAHALLALATWLSPDVARPTPGLRFARATRRNGTA